MRSKKKVKTVLTNGLNPEAYLRDVLSHIAQYPINRIEEMLRWNLGRGARLKHTPRSIATTARQDVLRWTLTLFGAAAHFHRLPHPNSRYRHQ